mmetsp:Transcript_15303/g.31119  ORF Transcript_15303/g.31119 Transcript_15303/m.31119 type:complete len:343 (+) Transcript_15303:155-1183(+)|eukprot:scaffold23287_cov175-Amphora_coffeaeformis.AAC.3
MKILLGFALLTGITQAFVPLRTPQARRSPIASAPPMIDFELAQKEAKQALLETAKKLKSEYGSLLVEKSAKEEFKAAVEELENKSEPPSIEDYSDMFLGDWTLLCTTSTNNEGVDTSKLPFFKQDPLKKIRDSIREAANKYIKVQQKVRSSKNDGVIDRIDNTIEYEPPESLRELLDNVPESLSQLNINPLHVSKSQLVLIHKATIESEMPLKTKLVLESIVLNVAGDSTYLEPNGADIAGINLPLGEFAGAGTFETTYLDDSLRISRGKQGFVEQLRVFVRSDKLAMQDALEEIVEKKASKQAVVDAQIEEEEDEIVAIDEVEEEDEDPPSPEMDNDEPEI